MSYRERTIQYPIRVEPRLTNFEETVQLDKWFVQDFNQAIRNKIRQQFYPYLFYTEFSALDLRLFKWFVQHFNRAIRHKQTPHLYPSFFVNQDPFYVRARGFILGLNKDTNTGIGVRKIPIPGLNKDTNTGIGIRKA